MGDIKIEKRNKCVYRHITLDTNEVFYVGMGSYNRPYKIHGRSKYWHNVTNKHGYEIQILQKNLTREEANVLEVILVDYYGRRDLGKGNLVNLTSGGDGSPGHKRIPSEESNEKRRQANLGQIHSQKRRDKRVKTYRERGYKPSEKNRQAILISVCKPIIQYSLEGIFIKEHVSQAQAKRELGMGLSIGAVLSNKKKTAGGFIWRYKEECLINTNKKK